MFTSDTRVLVVLLDGTKKRGALARSYAGEGAVHLKNAIIPAEQVKYVELVPREA